MRRNLLGVMSCGVAGILTGAASLTVPAFGQAVLVPNDVGGLFGLGVEVPPEPYDPSLCLAASNRARASSRRSCR